MRKIRKVNKNSLLKKMFIKICRFLNYEIIDQNNFYLPVTEQCLDEDLSIVGKRSLTVPMGNVEITRKVKSLTIILRTCANVHLLTQSKRRIFDKEKSEYTLRTLNSIIKSVNFSKNIFKDINLEIIIIDHNSDQKTIDKMKLLISKQFFKSQIIPLNMDNFINNINPINEKKEKVTFNQMSNMTNIHQSLLLSKKCDDLVYFVEDDYIHSIESIKEMILTYEKLSSILKKELILCPTDYPYLYTKTVNSKIFLGDKKHWRTVNETLCTFLTSRIIIEKYWEKLDKWCKFEHYPFEKPLNEIYETEYCLSPIPSLAMHCTNINSSFGLSPNYNWKKIWDENETR
jgi:hypothetical protein|tara:strand:+ start:420 stop:1451 length:1032 start_codon:yes stop_codon:yes gene_type:complete